MLGDRFTQKGSLDSSAPETFGDQPQNQKVDIWGLGVIIYVLYAKCQPFYVKGMSYETITENIKQCKVKYPETMCEPIRKIL